MNDSITTRRRFLVAAIAFSGLTTGVIGPAALRFASAWAQSGQDKISAALVRLARLLLPHDGLSDDDYAAALDDSLGATAGDPSVTRLVTLLNEQQSAAFMDIGEDAQLAAMHAIENEDAFAGVLASVKARLYEHPAVWKVINYEGPSYQDGGYLNRGAGDIDWLPEVD